MSRSFLLTSTNKCIIAQKPVAIIKNKPIPMVIINVLVSFALVMTAMYKTK
ncbi:MAG: hypothetical protein FWE33_06350 [Defluviitaleaceae bacterium]|nr:hypothetical protein [Defluviitaleaceae bacterium]